MARKSESTNEKRVMVLQGKNPMNRNTYFLRIHVENGRIWNIEHKGCKPNLFIQDLCKNFNMKKPANITDVYNIIKLAMIQRCEYVTEFEANG